MRDTNSIEKRIRRLEDREAIHELIARYAIAMDDRDLAAFPEVFTQDTVLRSQDGVMNAVGLAAVTELFRGRFLVLGPSNHFTHDKILQFDERDADVASGIVSSHAEMNRKGEAMLAAIRYHDRYRRDAGQWKIAERVLSFFYYVPTSQYLDALGPGLATRMRAYDTPRPADWPEGLSTWRHYHGD
jgi:ketosteroid isomerase-like protein